MKKTDAQVELFREKNPLAERFFTVCVRYSLWSFTPNVHSVGCDGCAVIAQRGLVRGELGGIANISPYVS